MPLPTDLPSLQSWITSDPPYENITHDRSPFPEVNDFTAVELVAALQYALSEFHANKAALGKALADDRLKGRQIEPTLVDALNVHEYTHPGPIDRIAPSRFLHVALASKVADDIFFQNSLVDLAKGIKSFKFESAKVEKMMVGHDSGDEDDWFLVAREQETGYRCSEQERLYRDIERRLKDVALGREEEEREGEIPVRMEIERA